MSTSSSRIASVAASPCAAARDSLAAERTAWSRAAAAVAALTERERADLVFGIKLAFDDPAGRLKAGLPVRLEVPLSP